MIHSFSIGSWSLFFVCFRRFNWSWNETLFFLSFSSTNSKWVWAQYAFLFMCPIWLSSLFLPLQRGIPAVSPDMLNQFPAAPVPTLSGFPMPLPAAVSQQPLLPTGPPVSMPLSIGPPVMGMGITAAAPAGGAAAPPAGAFVPSYPPSQVRALHGWYGPAGRMGLFQNCVMALNKCQGADEV